MARPIHKIGIDFDGVIYPNRKFKGVTVLHEEPMEGALEAIQLLSESYIVLVQSSRCNGRKGFEVVKAWLKHYGFDEFCEAVEAAFPPEGVVVECPETGELVFVEDESGDEQ